MKLAVCTAPDGPVNVFLLTDVHVSVGSETFVSLLPSPSGGQTPAAADAGSAWEDVEMLKEMEEEEMEEMLKSRRPHILMSVSMLY